MLASILHPFRGASCSGCGELYLGGFHSDPPDCCDPCDHCGNFTGGGPSFGGYAHGGPAFGGYAGGGSPRATHCSTCGNGSAGAWGGEGNVSYGTPHATTQTGYMVEGQPGPFGGPQARAPQGTMPLR